MECTCTIKPMSTLRAQWSQLPLPATQQDLLQPRLPYKFSQWLTTPYQHPRSAKPRLNRLTERPQRQSGLQLPCKTPAESITISRVNPRHTHRWYLPRLRCRRSIFHNRMLFLRVWLVTNIPLPACHRCLYLQQRHTPRRSVHLSPQPTLNTVLVRLPHLVRDLLLSFPTRSWFVHQQCHSIPRILFPRA